MIWFCRALQDAVLNNLQVRIESNSLLVLLRELHAAHTHAKDEWGQMNIDSLGLLPTYMESISGHEMSDHCLFYIVAPEMEGLDLRLAYQR